MSEPMIHPIERIRDAFARAHAICVGSRAHYMSIPPDPERDADLILTDAIEELAALRARVAELEREVELLRDTASTEARLACAWARKLPDDHWMIRDGIVIGLRSLIALGPRAEGEAQDAR